MSESKTPKAEDYVKRGDLALSTALEYLEKDTMWTLQSQDERTTIWNSTHPATGCNMNKALTILDVPPYMLYDLTFHVESNTRWRPNLKFFELIESISANTDIARLHVKGVTGISERDFLDTRRWVLRDKPGSFMYAFISCEHDKAPPVSGVVRGVNHIGSLLVEPHPSDPKKCYMQWIFCSDIKGWVPAALIRLSSNKFIVDAFKEFNGAGKRMLDGWNEYKGYEEEDAAKGMPQRRRWAAFTIGYNALKEANEGMLNGKGADEVKKAWDTSRDKLNEFITKTGPSADQTEATKIVQSASITPIGTASTAKNASAASSKDDSKTCN